jgi:hypothetical protein
MTPRKQVKNDQTLILNVRFRSDDSLTIKDLAPAVYALLSTQIVALTHIMVC